MHSLEPANGTLEHQETLIGPDRWERAGLVSRVEWVRSDDGVEIPMTIVHRVDLPTPAPTILYGYGAYGVSSRPTPNADAMFWLSRGWVLATAHVRGGGELGPRWHRAGSGKLKERSIADFIACAQHLVATGTSSPSQLAARGGSAGGLLVCGAAVRRPDLFAAVVAHNPVTDVIEFLADRTGRLAGPGVNEFGDIFNHHDVYEAVKRYNPYDNVTFNDYPAFLFTTGREDERVPWWHAARLALPAPRLQHRSSPDRPRHQRDRRPHRREQSRHQPRRTDRGIPRDRHWSLGQASRGVCQVRPGLRHEQADRDDHTDRDDDAAEHDGRDPPAVPSAERAADDRTDRDQQHRYPTRRLRRG